MRHKSDTKQVVQQHVTWAERVTNEKVVKIVTDVEGNFIGPLHAWLQTKGIIWAQHAPCSPNLTGMAERAVQHLKGKLRVLLKHSDKPVRLWELALVTVTSVKNVTLTRSAVDPTRTPWQLFRGTVPNLKHFKVWGCPGCRFVPKEEREDRTFSDGAEPGCHMGVDPESQSTFWFLTRTWGLKRGATGVPHENLKHVDGLPDCERVQDGITQDVTSSDQLLEAKLPPQEPIFQTPMRPVDPRAKQIDMIQDSSMSPTPSPGEEKDEQGHEKDLEPENHDLGDFGSNLGDFGNDLGPDPPLHGPVEEQLETPTAAAEEEQAATRRSTRLNRGQATERYQDRDFELEKVMNRSKNDPKIRRLYEIDRVLTKKTDPYGSKWMRVKFTGYDDPEWIKEGQLAKDTASIMEETAAGLTQADQIFSLMHNAVCSSHTMTGQTDVMNCRHYDIMRRPDAAEWVKAHRKEIEGMKARDTLRIVPIKPDMTIRDTRWVYAVKGVDAKGVRRRRARLVFRGDQQKAGIDHFTTCSGTPHAATVRFMLALSALLGLRLAAMDVSQACLNGRRDKAPCCKIPEGWHDSKFAGNGTDWRLARKTMCCEVLGNMHGTKDAASIWGELAAETLTGPLGMTRSQIDGCLFIDKKTSKGLIGHAANDHERNPGTCTSAIDFEQKAQAQGQLLSLKTLYVDDGLSGTAETKLALNRASRRAKQMNEKWGLKLEGSGVHETHAGNELTRPTHEKDFKGMFNASERQTRFKCTHLGVTIVRKNGSISMSQEEYLRKVLERLGYGSQSQAGRRPVKNPFPAGWKPTACLESKSVSDTKKTEHRSAVAALNHAASQARPDLKLPVSILAAYFNDPKDEHFTALDYLLRCVKHTITWRIEFMHKGDQKVTGHVDASFADCLDTRRSRTGHVWMLADGPVMWQSETQKSMKPARSTAESELVAAAAALEDGNHLINLSKECGQRFRVTKLMIREDNQAVIRIVNNRWTSPRTKALDIRHFWVRAHVLQGSVDFMHVGTKHQIADALTKVLNSEERQRHFEAMGVKFESII